MNPRSLLFKSSFTFDGGLNRDVTFSPDTRRDTTDEILILAFPHANFFPRSKEKNLMYYHLAQDQQVH